MVTYTKIFFLALLLHRLDYCEGISMSLMSWYSKGDGCLSTKQSKQKPRAVLEERSAASAGEAQLDTGGGRPGRRVWMIFGFGEFFGSSSSSMSLSQTCTTTLGVDSVPACSSYFSPGSRKKNRSKGHSLSSSTDHGALGVQNTPASGWVSRGTGIQPSKHLAWSHVTPLGLGLVFCLLVFFQSSMAPVPFEVH